MEGELDLGDLPLGPLEAVEVRVLDEANGPVPQASVTLHRVIEDRAREPDGFGYRAQVVSAPPPGDPVFTGASDGQGVARFPAVPPGEWLAVASAPGFSREREGVLVIEGLRRERTTVRLHHGFSLGGTIRRADGTPAPGIRIRAQRPLWNTRTYRPGSVIADGSSGEDGAYRIEGLLRGRNQLWAETSPGSWCGLGLVQIPVTGAHDLRLPDLLALEGFVLDAADGSPLAGALVVASRDLASVGEDARVALQAEGVSGADGAFRIPGIPAGTQFSLAASRAGFVPWTGMVECLPGSPLPEQEIRLSRGSVIRGRVLLVDGTPVGNAVVWSRPVREKSGAFRGKELGEETRRVRTGADGAFRIEGVEPGTALVAATADGLLLPEMPLGLSWGYHPDEVPDSLLLEVPPTGEAVRDLTLMPGAVLQGIVVDEGGRPAAGLSVRVGSLPRMDRHQNQAMVPEGEGLAGPSAADGSFRVEGLLAGTKRFVYAHGPGFLEGWSETFDLAEGETRKDLRITVRRIAGTVAGVVRYEDGSPAAGAQVGLATWEMDAPPAELDDDTTIPVDAAGAFRAEGVRAGEYTVYASSADNPSVLGPRVKVGAGETLEGIALVMPRGRAVEGRVVDGDGRPVAGASVRVAPIGEDEEAPPEEYSYYSSPGGNGPRIPVIARSTATADAGGRFRQGGLAPREYWVTAGAPGFMEAWTRARAGEGEIDLKLARALSIAGRAVDSASGAPAAGIPISIQAPEGVVLPSEPGWFTTGADGAFTIPGLAPGNYRIQFASHMNKPDLEYQETDVEGVAAGTKDLAVRIPRGLLLAGKVLDQEGGPVADLSLLLHEDSEEMWSHPFGVAHLQTGKDGGFRFGGLGSKRYKLVIGTAITFAEGAGNSQVIGKIVDGLEAGTGDIVVSVQRGLPIRGRVLDPDGRPARPGDGGNGRVVIVPAGEERESGRENTCFADSGTALFETEALLPGRTYDLYASGFADTVGAVLKGIAPGAKVEIRLEGGLRLAGRVVDEGGSPVPSEVTVTVRMPGDDADTFEGRLRSTKTLADGTFRFAGLLEGKYLIDAGGDGSDFIASTTKEAVPSGTTDAVVTLKRGVSISGRLLDAKGKAVRYPRIVVEGEAEHQQGEEDGTFHLRGLKPGKKRLLTPEGGQGPDIDLGTYDAPSVNLVLTLPANPQPPRKSDDGDEEKDE